MRVIEPPQFKAKNKQSKNRKKIGLATAVVGIGLLVSFFLISGSSRTYVARVFGAHILRREKATSTDTWHYIAPPEFTGLYAKMIFPNTRILPEAPSITGSAEADNRIRTIALSRGYRLMATPVASIVKVDDQLLQPLAAESWQALVASAQRDSISLRLVSGYRSIDDQRSRFNQQLSHRKIPVTKIVKGEVDTQVVDVLKTTAIPGYSRHHTGYTVDVACGNDQRAFEQTPCYQWLIKDNYSNAKRHGWIPGYPEGETQQAAETETYQFSWVGKSVLLEQ